MKNMIHLNKHLLVAATTLSVFTVTAREKIGYVHKSSNVLKVAAACSQPQAAAELAVNNVRTFIFSGSDIWWDLFGSTGGPRYAVPKVDDWSKAVSSNFAGNVWFGGIDLGGQLKVAAQTYRQDGVDFWTGPLSTVDASTSSDVCSQYDKIFKIKRAEVDAFVLSGGAITPNIAAWPGNGDLSLNHDPVLAPYMDVDGSGSYNPEAGDYPYYDVYNTAAKDNLGNCKARVFGDETLWWVYNDNGDVHSATGGKAIGMEIRAQAFAFKTTDEINNMTFYSYELINRSSFQLNNTYMTVFSDADLGCYNDDYIGCDVKRGMGYIYNADNYDADGCQSGGKGYGTSIPALGCDFFQGPVNTLDSKDNDGDGFTDEPGEQMGMTGFTYFNNIAGPQGDPSNASQTYQYMTGFWKDGTPFTCGANAYGGSLPTKFVFPSDPSTGVSTDPANTCGSWSEVSAANTPNDRRFLQSSGPFTLMPGAINYVTFGLPWARTASTDQLASIPLLKIADDKAQALFDNCFQVLSGPEAPDMTIQEMENELVLYFTNKPASNNYLNNYKELDVSIIVDTVNPMFGSTPSFTMVNRYYKFEGFKVFQLRSETVTQEELTDPSKAKLAFSSDVANGIKTLINYEYDASVGGDVGKVKAQGVDNGIKSTFHFTKDLFSSTSDQKVVNNKTYYFMTVAYGYNEYAKYKEDQPLTAQNAPSYLGQKRPYLEGRKSKKAYGVPHNPDPEKDGTLAQSIYGYGPKITRHEGQGNGGNYLDFTESTINDILASSTGMAEKITYDNGRGPIAVKVVDPLNVPNAEFAVKFIKKNMYSNPDSAKLHACDYNYNSNISYKATAYGSLAGDSITWVLRNNSNGKEYVPCKSIKVGEEYYFADLGLSVNIGQVRDVAGVSYPANSATDKMVQDGDVIAASISYADQTKPWLTGLPDADGTTAYNWIRSGGYVGTSGNQNDVKFGTNFADPNSLFEGILGGTWAPYCLTAGTSTDVAAAPASILTNPSGPSVVSDLRTLASVDIVFTTDKSKWTRALVLEECDLQSSNPTNGKKLEPKRRKSVDKQGIAWDAPGANVAEALLDTHKIGCSWFPGYAINLETGERLQIAFGEDSYQGAENGNDMMWNPTSATSQKSALDPNGYFSYPNFGGRHYIYVFGHNRSNSRYSGITSAASVLNGKLMGVGAYSDNNFKEMATTYKWLFASATSTPIQNALKNFWTEAMWVNIPVVKEERFEFTNPANMPCDVKVKLRVKKSYKTRSAGLAHINNSLQLNLTTNALFQNTQVGGGAPSTGASVAVALSSDSVANPVNNNMPYYTFSTADIFAEINNADKSKSSLDLINVVPNPYYAYSTYETGRADNRIKITNLPNKCKIKIFTLNGTLVRTFNRDVTGQEDLTETSTDFVHSKRLSFQDWDLKNQSGISVASGLYIIHIDVPGVGEKILKWFGVMRPLDLQSY